MNQGPLKGVRAARYLMVMMGFFSVFCGMMYNDFMALPLQLFGGSCYNKPYHFGANAPKIEEFTHKPDCMYPAGVDWMWYQGSNALVYFNSMKMKIAVIFGVI